MVVITIDAVLRVYNSLLNNTLSYSKADRWAWDLMQKFDNGDLRFKPVQDESLIWELIQFLYGLDIPAIKDRNKTARTKIDIIDFLKKKNIYEKVKTYD
jgi:hypothetical protein